MSFQKCMKIEKIEMLFSIFLSSSGIATPFIPSAFQSIFKTLFSSITLFDLLSDPFLE